MAGIHEFLPSDELFLFAEKFVNYVMLKNARIVMFTHRDERNSHLTYGGFNETTKEVIQILEDIMQIQNTFEKMRANNCLNLTVYGRYAENLRNAFFAEGFDAVKLLYYCTHFASLAACFHAHGVPSANCLAQSYIVMALQACNMNNYEWDTLKRTAEDILSTAQQSM